MGRSGSTTSSSSLGKRDSSVSASWDSLNWAYAQEDWDAVEAHMERYFGHCDNVFHEIMSPDIHVDIYIMPPTPERNYYVLSTFGMGAHRMNVPAELAEQKLERAELIVTLPPDWKISEPGEQWYWPIRWPAMYFLHSWTKPGASSSSGSSWAARSKQGRAFSSSH